MSSSKQKRMTGARLKRHNSRLTHTNETVLADRVRVNSSEITATDSTGKFVSKEAEPLGDDQRKYGIISSLRNSFAAADIGDYRMDPFVVITHGPQKYQTPTAVNAHLEADWTSKNIFSLYLSQKPGSRLPEPLRFEVRDDNGVGLSQQIGVAIVDPQVYMKNADEVFEELVSLRDSDGFRSGVLRIFVTYGSKNRRFSVTIKSCSGMADLKKKHLRDLRGHFDNAALACGVVAIASYFLIASLIFALVPNMMVPETVGPMNLRQPSPTATDAIYFAMTILMTVGFGDFFPRTPYTRLLCSFFLLFGIGLIGTALGNVAADVAARREKMLLEMRVKARQRRVVQRQRDKKAELFTTLDTPLTDSEVMEKAVTEVSEDDATGCHCCGLPLSVSQAQLVTDLCVLMFTLAIGTTGYVVDQSGSTKGLHGDMVKSGIYFAVVACTSAGFGDLTVSTQGGRWFMNFYMLVGCIVVAKCLGDLAAMPFHSRRRRLEKHVRTQFGRDLSSDELEVLSLTGRTSGVVSRDEFLINMLLKLERITEYDISECLEQFELLDKNNSGSLTIDDVSATGNEEQSSFDQHLHSAQPKLRKRETDNLKLRRELSIGGKKFKITKVPGDDTCYSDPRAMVTKTGGRKWLEFQKLVKTEKRRRFLVKPDHHNVRVAPDMGAAVLKVLKRGDVVTVIRQKGQWFQLDNGAWTKWRHGNVFYFSPTIRSALTSVLSRARKRIGNKVKPAGGTEEDSKDVDKLLSKLKQKKVLSVS